ncbi:hypothetical protein QUW13_08255 [Enterococcus hirae]|nr:hypothetical protein [Enterococcus hirae]
MISRLRKKVIPICAKRNGSAADHGYYIAKSEQEKRTSSEMEEVDCVIKIIQGEWVEIIEPPLFGNVILSFHAGALKWIEENQRKKFDRSYLRTGG